MLDYFPKYFTNKAIILYLISMILISLLFFSHIMSLIWWILGFTAVIGFFYFSNIYSRKWSNFTPNTFSKKIFLTAFIIRVIWVLFSYVLYVIMTGQPFEFSVGDAKMYQRIAEALAETGFGNYENVFWGMPVSDRGYGTYLGVLYMVVGNNILIARLIKALLGAWMCVLIYKLSTRNFGEAVGRIAAIFCMLMPNLIYYSGLHLKEAEMLFLVVLFMERADSLIRVHKYTFMTVIPTLLIGGSLFFFRTVLGATAMFSFFTALIFSSRRVMTMSKKVVITGWVIVALAFFAGSTIINEVEEIWESRYENQESSLDFRAKRVGGNEFAKYASKSVFVPFIFIIPFPTMVDVAHQQNQQLLHGGYVVKNIIAFFVLFALIYIVREKKWRDNIMIISFTVAYLIVVALSAFAQSERFHLPALPFLLIIAAYGISNFSNSDKKYFNWYLIMIFLIFVAWNWFKLAGRGLA